MPLVAAFVEITMTVGAAVIATATGIAMVNGKSDTRDERSRVRREVRLSVSGSISQNFHLLKSQKMKFNV